MYRSLLCAALLILGPLTAGAEVAVSDAYAISALETSPSGAVFMTIDNPGGPADRLLGARSAAARRVELHSHVMTADGAMAMVPIEGGLPLPADGRIQMVRGGDHVMFMGLTGPWQDGATIDLILIFETAGDVAVSVPVDRSRLGDGAMDTGAGG